jgi:hypothetical protein
MNEHDFSKKLVTLLDTDVNNISDKVALDLRAARHSAVAHAVSRQSSGVGRSGNLLHRHSWFSQHRTAVIGAVLIAVLLSVLGVWQMLPQPADDQAEIDAALLTDDLPVHAYLDNHFTQWLKNPSSEQ